MNGQHPLMHGVRPGWYYEKGCHGGVINDIAIHGIDIARLLTGGDVSSVSAARMWNFYASEHPDFYNSAQFIIKMTNGAGVIADVSYSSPDSFGYTLPSYWNFHVCGEGGIMTFSYNSDGVTVFKNGKQKAEHYPATVSGEDYLDRFLCDIKSGDMTNTKRCLSSAEQTLLLQNNAVIG